MLSNLQIYEKIKETFDEKNSRFKIKKVRVGIVHCDKKYIGEGIVTLKLYPRPRVFIDCNVVCEEFKILKQLSTLDANELEFYFDDERIEGRIIHSNMELFDPKTPLTLIYRIDKFDYPKINKDSLNFVTFGIFNIDRLSYESMKLNFKDWRCVVSSHKDTGDNLKLLQDMGGFQITHIGILNKQNFSMKKSDADDYINKVKLFIAFLSGCICTPNFIAGYDDKSEIIWEKIIPTRDSFSTVIGWFDEDIVRDVEKLFPMMMNKLESDEFNNFFKEILNWYIEANATPLNEVSLIVSQAALEKVSFWHSVQEKRLILKDSFKNLKASDKMRLLFSYFNIPLEIPDSLADLKALSKKQKWIDGPHAITEVRNSYVHPEHKNRGEFRKVMFDTWNLSQWYLEVSLLAIFNYSGKYHNRLDLPIMLGKVQDMPWNETNDL